MKIIIFILLIFTIGVNAKNSEYININFKNLDIEEFIKITSKQLDKNIFYLGKIEGKVDFVANKSIKKQKLLELLKFTLLKKGYVLKDEGTIFKIENTNTPLNQEEKKVEIIAIKNLEAQNVLKVLNKIYSNKKSNTNPLITIENDTNSIIIVGSKADTETIKKFIKKIDILNPQIYIKAKIVEISETKTKEVGLEYGLNGFNKYSSTNLSTFSSSFNSLSNTAINFSEFSTFGFDINSLSKGLSLGATINFLKQNQAIDVISEPSILCINNKESSIYVGETKSFKTGQTTNTSGTTESYKREEIGLRLKVKPRISNNKIILQINTVLEDAKESTTSENLDTSKKEVITTAILNNAESVIIGGLIKSKKFQTESGLPVLKDIPILGSLFKNEKYINDKINLVVIITPYIVPKDSTLSIIKSKVDYLQNLEDVYVNSLIKKLEEKRVEKSSVGRTTSSNALEKIYTNVEN
ncbi:MAG: secretin N-terminal domain-containing protein [Arcobacter sp.]|uniref:type II secretion system protein GspD n=1 Tax=Arcobacter sp. TaxID=1872629 RepID=UPI003C791A77